MEMFCLESLSIRHYEDMGRRQNPRSREKKIINIRVAAMGTSLEIQTVVLVKCCVCVCRDSSPAWIRGSFDRDE